MKYISLLLLIFTVFNCNNRTTKKTEETSKQQELPTADKTTIAAKDIHRVINFLASDSLAGRDTGSEGLKIAADFIISEFKKHKVQPYFDTYLDSFEAKGVETYNVVGFLPGSDPQLKNEFVIVGAHFDHIGTAAMVNGDKIANGANDNAAGSTAVITLAKYFGDLTSNKRSILFILFGAEEIGLLGSKHLSKRLKEENLNLYTMINFEMIGVPLQNRDYKAYVTGYEMSNMSEKINEYAGSQLTGFLLKSKEFQLFRRSDNFPFFKEFRVPCQTISTFDFSNYEYYHHVDDEVSNLDISFMTELINGCIPVVNKIVNTPTKEIILN